MQSSWSFRCCCCCKTIILNSFIILFKTVEHNVLCLCSDCAWCICLNLVYLCSTIETGSTVVILHCGVAGLFCVCRTIDLIFFSFLVLLTVEHCVLFMCNNCAWCICICLNLSVALVKLD